MSEDRAGEAMVQLATRVPKDLHRQVKVHCVRAETSVMTFVIQALSDRLKARSTTRSQRPARPGVAK